MPSDDWRLAARLIAATGARVGDVVALRSMDLDSATGRLALGACEGAAKLNRCPDQTRVRWRDLIQRA